MTTNYRIRKKSTRQAKVRHANRFPSWRLPAMMPSMTLDQIAKSGYGQILARVVLSPTDAFIWVYQVLGRPNTLRGFNNVYTDNRRRYQIRMEQRHYGTKDKWRCDTQVLIPAVLLSTYYVDANVADHQPRNCPIRCRSARDVFANLKPDHGRYDFGGGDVHYLSSFASHNRVLTFDSVQKAIALVQRALRTNYYREYVREEMIEMEDDLYPYQSEAIERISSAHNINQVSLPTGAGKTATLDTATDC